MRIVITENGQRFVFKTIVGGDRTTRFAFRPVQQPARSTQQPVDLPDGAKHG